MMNEAYLYCNIKYSFQYKFVLLLCSHSNSRIPSRNIIIGIILTRKIEVHAGMRISHSNELRNASAKIKKLALMASTAKISHSTTEHFPAIEQPAPHLFQ